MSFGGVTAVDDDAAEGRGLASLVRPLARPEAGVATDICLGLTLVLVWALLHCYSGIDGDARIYMGRVLADLDPAGVGRDIMFAMDGQSSFSFYRIVARVLAAHLGFGATVALLSITNLLVWFAAMALFVRAVVPARTVGLVLAAVCILPRLYAPWNLLAAGEAIPVPRPLAEAFVMLALAALVHRRYALCVVSLTAAAAFHPIMAAPGFGVLLVVLGLRDWRWFAVAALLAGCALCAGALGLPLLSRLRLRVDPAWLDLLLARNPYLFMHLWPTDAMGLPAVQFATVLIGAAGLPFRVGRIFHAALAVGVLGCAASYVFADELANLLVLQAQLWRALWLPAVLAPIAAGLCLAQLPGQGARGQVTLAFLCLGWLTADTFPLAPIAAGAAAAAYLGIPRLTFRPGRLMVGTIWTTCIVFAALCNWGSIIALQSILPGAPDDIGVGAIWTMIAGLKLPTVPLLLLAYAAWRLPRAASTRVGAALAAAICVIFMSTVWDLRTPAHADADAATVKPDLVALLAPRPGQVLWIDGDDGWAWARRANWNGLTQGGGIVFSRDLAMVWNERAHAMLEAGLATPYMLHPWSDKISLRAFDLDPAKIARFCARPDSPAWIVASLEPGTEPPEKLGAAVWSPPFAQTKLYIVAPDARWRRLDRYAVIPCSGANVR